MAWQRAGASGATVSVIGCLWGILAAGAAGGAELVKYCRFRAGETVAYGIVEGEMVRQLSGDLFGEWSRTQKTFPLKQVQLLVPTQPTQVVAMAGNYKSHLGGGATITTVTTVTTIRRDAKTGQVTTQSATTTETRVAGDIPPKYQIPQPFFKSVSCLIPHEADIVMPRDAQVVHYEGEVVLVIGRRAKDVPKASALEYVFGVTCGNDVSERVWQKNDIQWWRAKGADTFGPCGPFIACGLDYDNLMLQLRLNGQVKQKESTRQFIHDVATMVSTISRYVTLEPGDLIFTGTPGEPTSIRPGDVVEVEVEGVGVLRNRVVAEK